MDNHIAQAAFSIIKTDLLPHDIGNMTEQQRQDLISFGMEKARYLAGKMGDKGALFLEAMEEVAKYGMSGKTDSAGKVTYNIQWGPPPGWPDDHVNTSELMQEVSPDQWKIYQDMSRRAQRTGAGKQTASFGTGRSGLTSTAVKRSMRSNPATRYGSRS